MKKVIITISLIILVKLVIGQDVIIKKTGDEIKGTVSEVTATDIKHKKVDNPNVTYSIPISDVFMIQYQNGAKDVFNAINTTTPTTTNTTTTTTPTITPTINNTQTNSTTPATTTTKTTTTPTNQNVTTVNNTTTTNSQQDICKQAKIDMKKTYEPNGAVWGTYLTAAFGSPLFGLIPAFSCSSHPPKDKKLDIAPMYSNNDEYKNCFKAAANKRKKGQTWLGYGLGCVTFAAIMVILITSIQASQTTGQ